MDIDTIQCRGLNKEDKMYKIYWDGYSSPHKKNKAGYCVVIKNEDSILSIEHRSIKENSTCNEAELWGLFRAIEVAGSLSARDETIYIYGDSKLAIGLFYGYFKTKIDRLSHVLERIYEKLNCFSPLRIQVSWVSRKNNPAGKFLEKLNGKGAIS